MDDSDKLTWGPYVGRGALGGAIGSFVVLGVATIYIWSRYGGDNLSEVFAMLGVFALAGGVIAGLVVGYIIYKVTGRNGTQPNAAVRIAVGTGALLIYGLLTGLTSNRPFRLTFEVGYAIAVGGLAGLMSRAKIRPSQDRA